MQRIGIIATWLEQ